MLKKPTAKQQPKQKEESEIAFLNRMKTADKLSQGDKERAVSMINQEYNAEMNARGKTAPLDYVSNYMKSNGFSQSIKIGIIAEVAKGASKIVPAPSVSARSLVAEELKIAKAANEKAINRAADYAYKYNMMDLAAAGHVFSQPISRPGSSLEKNADSLALRKFNLLADKDREEADEFIRRYNSLKKGEA